MTLLTDSHQLESKRRSVAMAQPNSLVHVEVLLTREEVVEWSSCHADDCQP